MSLRVAFTENIAPLITVLANLRELSRAIES